MIAAQVTPIRDLKGYLQSEQVEQWTTVDGPFGTDQFPAISLLSAYGERTCKRRSYN